MKKVKRLFTLTLLILANIFLLAHSVLPHSHHDGIVCFSLEELMHQHNCLSQHNDMEQCCSGNKEENHHHADSEKCDLKEIVLRNDTSVHEDILPCANCLSLLYTIYSLNEFYLEAPDSGLWLEQKPYVNNYIHPFVGSIKGLRAPPVSSFLA